MFFLCDSIELWQFALYGDVEMVWEIREHQRHWVRFTVIVHLPNLSLPCRAWNNKTKKGSFHAKHRNVTLSAACVAKMLKPVLSACEPKHLFRSKIASTTIAHQIYVFVSTSALKLFFKNWFISSGIINQPPIYHLRCQILSNRRKWLPKLPLWNHCNLNRLFACDYRRKSSPI